MADTPLINKNPTHSLKRAHESVPPLQFVRELVQNGIEAGANTIQVKKHELYVEGNSTSKFVVIDNGEGMTKEAMFEHLAQLNASSKASNSDTHENFGIGAKITTTMWNPYGVVFVSWHKDNPEQGHLVWLHYNNVYGQICLKGFEEEVKTTHEDGEVEFEHEPITSIINGKRQNVIPLRSHEENQKCGDLGFINWNDLKPSSGHGTVVVLLGKSSTDNTWTNSRGEKLSDRDLLYYLNLRYSELPDSVSLHVSSSTSSSRFMGDTPEERELGPRVQGFYKTYENMPLNYLQDRHTLKTDNGFEVITLVTRQHAEWKKDYAEATNTNTKGKSKVDQAIKVKDLENGFVAIEYDTGHTKELFNWETSKNTLRSWGLHAKEVAPRVRIIIKAPQRDDTKGKHGVYPNEGRDLLLWLDEDPAKRDTNKIDLDELRSYYVKNLPECVRVLNEEAFSSYKAKEVDLTKVYERYAGLEGTNKRLSVIEDENGNLTFKPRQRAQKVNVGTNPHNETPTHQKKKVGENNTEGSQKGSAVKTKRKMKVIPTIVPYKPEKPEENVTDSFEVNGVIYPAFVQIGHDDEGEEAWRLYIMQNHDYIKKLSHHFLNTKETLTLEPVKETIFKHIIGELTSYLNFLESEKLTDSKYTENIALHAKLIGAFNMWDMISRDLGKLGR